MKELKWSAIWEGIILLVLGILLVCFPKASASVVCTLIGIGCLIGGVVCIINYCMIDVRDIFYRNDLVMGIFLILFGLLALYKKNVLAEILPIIFGLVILISGLVKVQSASVAKKNRLSWRQCLYDSWRDFHHSRRDHHVLPAGQRGNGNTVYRHWHRHDLLWYF